ncbi:MAG: N-acetyltransferase family protein [Hyphomicrobiaceae bacterium]
MTVTIRAARLEDLPQILDITNDVIATSTAIYFDDPLTLENRRQWLEDRQRLGYPVLVAEEVGDVLGFSSFGDFRPWPGYRFTVEHSLLVRDGHRGKGIGEALVKALWPIAAKLGKHMIIAGVDAENRGSIRFHERLGFAMSAHLKEVGFKFGRRLDLVLLQRAIGEP